MRFVILKDIEPLKIEFFFYSLKSLLAITLTAFISYTIGLSFIYIFFSGVLAGQIALVYSFVNKEYKNRYILIWGIVAGLILMFLPAAKEIYSVYVISSLLLIFLSVYLRKYFNIFRNPLPFLIAIDFIVLGGNTVKGNIAYCFILSTITASIVIILLFSFLFRQKPLRMINIRLLKLYLSIPKNLNSSIQNLKNNSGSKNKMFLVDKFLSYSYEIAEIESNITSLPKTSYLFIIKLLRNSNDIIKSIYVIYRYSKELSEQDIDIESIIHLLSIYVDIFKTINKKIFNRNTIISLDQIEAAQKELVSKTSESLLLKPEYCNIVNAFSMLKYLVKDIDNILTKNKEIFNFR